MAWCIAQVSIGQFSLLGTSILLYAAGGFLSIMRAFSERRKLDRYGRLCLVLGIVCSMGVIVWHSSARRDWIPGQDSFDALVWLATLLALFVLYVQRHRPLGGLDWFVMPVVVLLLTAAAFAGDRVYHEYLKDAWSWVHRVTTFGGAIAFAIAAAAGAMYILSSRRLRHKAPVGPMFGSLERLEHLTMTAVTLGFALLTIGMIAGGVEILRQKHHTPSAKVILAVGVWLVYAVVLHAPINPSFRGRKVAVLSIAGFVLMLGVIVTVLLLPGGSR